MARTVATMRSMGMKMRRAPYSPPTTTSKPTLSSTAMDTHSARS